MALSSRNMVVGGIVLVTMLSVADMRYGSALRLPSVVDGMVIDGQNQGFSADETPSAELTRSMSVQTDGARGLDINNSRGSVTVVGGTSKEVEVSYTLKVYGGNKDKVREYAEKLKVESKRSGDQLLLRRALAEAPRGVRAVTVDWSVQVPMELEVAVDNHFGALDATNLGAPAELVNAYGRARVSGVKGDTRVKVRYGEADVQDIRGDLSISAAYGKSSVRSVTGSVESDASYGPFMADDTGGDLRVTSKYGDVRVSRVHGSVEVDSKYSAVRAEAFGGDVDVTSKYGQVTLAGITKDARVESKAGNVELELKSGVGGFRVEASVERGNFVNSTGSGEPFVAGRRDKSGSSVEISGKTGKGTHRVEVGASLGDVVLTYAP